MLVVLLIDKVHTIFIIINTQFYTTNEQKITSLE